VISRKYTGSELVVIERQPTHAFVEEVVFPITMLNVWMVVGKFKLRRERLILSNLILSLDL